MNILKTIQKAYQNGKVSLKQLIPMELLVASHFMSIIKYQENKILRDTCLKMKLIKRKMVIYEKLIPFFVSVILILITGFIGLTIQYII